MPRASVCAALGQVLTQRIGEIAALALRADAAPGRRPEAVKARIAEQVATLLDASSRFDPDRLHQEAILIASKADIREELDRLASHVAQAQRMIAEGGAIGRRLDFLAQELNREANTLCSKSNDVELTNIGLELKSVVLPAPEGEESTSISPRRAIASLARSPVRAAIRFTPGSAPARGTARPPSSTRARYW